MPESSIFCSLKKAIVASECNKFTGKKPCTYSSQVFVYNILSNFLQSSLFQAMKVATISFINQPEDCEDGDDDEEDVDEEEDPPCSINLASDGDITSFSFSFLLPVQTDL